MRHKDVPKLRELLESRGYREILRDDSWECNFVLADESGREVDVHSYTFDVDGKGATTMKGVFAAGDDVTGPKTVIEAVAAARQTAKAMDEYLRGGAAS